MYALNMIYWLNYDFFSTDRYVGSNFEKVQLEDGQVIWPTNFVDYLKSTIGNFNSSLGVCSSIIIDVGICHTHLVSGQKYMPLKNWEMN